MNILRLEYIYNHAQSIKIFMNTKTYSTLFIYPTIS